MRKRKLIGNTVASIAQQIITIVCGFILPRFILQFYGTDTNGLVSSITQFLGFISFMQLGVGAVVQSALYKPLAEKNDIEISKVYVSAERFFKKIALIFLVYIVVLCVIYPMIIGNDYDYLFVDSLIIIIAISLFVQYYFGLANQLLLNANQRAYIPLFCQSATLIANTICCVLLMSNGASIQIVKLVTSLLYIITPLTLMFYVKSKYNIDKKIKYTEEPIKQKWNGFAQHLSSVVMDNTDVMILTIFAKLSDVSIYYVYHLVVFGMRQLLTSLTVGIQSMIGNMLALEQNELLQRTFSKIESLFHLVVTFVYSCIIILVVPFVMIYTKGINDANYNVPIFAVLISLAFAAYCYRLPYYTVIKAAGHYKQTQNSAIIEMGLNISVSIVLVINFGLIGVAVGTIIATIYRTIYFVVYLSKNILYRKVYFFVKNVLLDVVAIVMSILFTKTFIMEANTYYDWIVMAIKGASICFLVCSVIFLAGNANQLFKWFGNRKSKVR